MQKISPVYFYTETGGIFLNRTRTKPVNRNGIFMKIMLDMLDEANYNEQRLVNANYYF